MLLAYASTSSGNSYGKPYSAKMECISVLCSPALPKTLITRPFGESALSGQSSIVTTTLSPSSAFKVLFIGTKMSVFILLPSTTTKAKFFFSWICIIPTYSVLARLIILVISPSSLPCFLRL